MSTRKYTHNCLGVDLTFEGPDSVEEIGKRTGNPDACLEAFMDQYAWHDRNPSLRALVAKKASDFTGEKPQENRKGRTRTVTQPDGSTVEEVLTESEAEFLSRLYAENKLSEAQKTQLIIEASEEIGAWVPSEGGRTSKPNARCYKQADELLAAIAAGKGTEERYKEKWSQRNARPFPGTEVDRDTVAKAFQLEFARLEAEAKQNQLD